MRIVASDAGAVLDSDLATGGGTDDTAALQAVLDRAADGTPLHVLIDGPALVSGLDVHSRTTIEFAPGAGLFLKEGSYRALIRNAHPSRDEIQDERIVVRGGFFNGNRRGQPELVYHGWSTQNGWGAPNRDSEGTFIAGLQFFGVRDLVVENVHVFDPRSFGIWISNVRHVVMSDITIDSNYPPVPENVPAEVVREYLAGFQSNLDGIHMNGPIQHVVMQRLRLRTEDDAIGMNANDMGVDDMATVDAMGPYVGQGPITDVVVRDVVLDDALLGFRLLSSDQRLDRVLFENLSGTIRGRMSIFSHFGSPTGGSFGSITFRNVAVDPRPFPTWHEMHPSAVDISEDHEGMGGQWHFAEESARPLVSVNSAVDRLTLDGLSAALIDDRPVVQVGPSGRVGVLRADLELRGRDATRRQLVTLPGAEIRDLELRVRTTPHGR